MNHIPDGRKILWEWNLSREASVAAQREYKEAQERNWKALVRMAEAHKNAVEIAGPEYAHLFVWPNELYGDRDEILAAAITGSRASITEFPSWSLGTSKLGKEE